MLQMPRNLFGKAPKISQYYKNDKRRSSQVAISGELSSLMVRASFPLVSESFKMSSSSEGAVAHPAPTPCQAMVGSDLTSSIISRTELSVSASLSAAPVFQWWQPSSFHYSRL